MTPVAERDGLTALERLRLHVHDHETFPFFPEDAEEILEEYEAALTELQHRRAEEAGTPDGWVLAPREATNAMLQAAADQLLGGGAEGSTMWDAMLTAAPKPNHIGGRLICEALGFDPTNHHNAAKCPYCTPASASPSSPATGVRVSEEERAKEAAFVAAGGAKRVEGHYSNALADLERVTVKPLVWVDGEDVSNALGYRIERGPDLFYVRSNEASGLFGTIEFADTIDEAKAAAQADYETRILSALGEQS